MTIHDGEVDLYMRPEQIRSTVIAATRYTKDDVALLMDRLFKELSLLRGDGQKEYAHADDRPFRNFETLAAELKTDRKQILWVYMRKHLDGILAAINGHISQREPVEGRIKDAILYLILLDAMFLEEAACRQETTT